MAADDHPKWRLINAANCPLCQDFFTDPVTLACGQNFCRGCLLRFWETPPALASVCPHCQERVQQKTLRPNRQLGYMVDAAKELKEQLSKDTKEWGVCESHQEPLMLFCKDDSAYVCLVCLRSGRHKEHQVVLAEAAAEEYKAQVGACLQNLRKVKEEVLASKRYVKTQGQNLIDVIEAERQISGSIFGYLRQFLEEEENLLSAQMEAAGKEVAQSLDEDLARLSEELSSYEKTIREMEEARGKPVGEVLKDSRSILQRCVEKRLPMPGPFQPDLRWRIWEFWDVNPIIMKASNKFLDTLKSETLQHQVKITLDPETAHPRLLVSEDGKCVMVRDEPQSLPASDRRFARHQCVLGLEAFQSGRHWWEVDVGKEEGWAVGVSLEPSHYDDVDAIGPVQGVWAIGKWEGQYQALTIPFNPLLRPREEPKKIRVSLNYTGGRVSFFDAESAVLLHTFSIATHSAYYPFFRLGMKSQLCLEL